MKDLERRLTTTTMSAAQESKIIKEISQLKESIPLAKKFSTIDPQIKELKAQKNKIWTEIKKIRAEEDHLNVQMEGIRKDLEAMNQEKGEIKDRLDTI